MHRIKPHQYEYTVTLPVSFHDCDAMGIVWHGNYLKFFETAREGLLRGHLLDYQAMEDSPYMYPVIEEQIRYRKPVSVFSSHISVRAYLEELYNRIRLGYEVFDAGHELCAFGYTVQVAVNRASHEMCMVTPEQFTRNFKDFKEV